MSSSRREAVNTYQNRAVSRSPIPASFDGIDAIFGNTRASIGLVLGLGLCGTGLTYIAYYFIVANLGGLTAASCDVADWRPSN